MPFLTESMHFVDWRFSGQKESTFEDWGFVSLNTDGV